MKITRTLRIGCAAMLFSAGWLAFASDSQANLLYTVTLNTASLVGNNNGPFSLDLVLGSGSTFPNSDNTVVLSNFSFTGGSAGAVSYSSGGQTGSMASSVSLTNSSEDNELSQYIGSGVTKISFNVNETSNTNNPFPDQFYVAILDGNLNNIATTDPSGGNTLIQSNINTAQTLASVAVFQGAANGTTPGVTAAVAAVPEPASVVSLLVGFGAMGLFARRKAVRRTVQA